MLLLSACTGISGGLSAAAGTAPQPATAAALPARSSSYFLARGEVQSFLREMRSKHQFEAAALDSWFSGLEPDALVLERMQRPAEKVLAWHEYRKLFISQRRIDAGKRYLQEHRDLFSKAEAEFGVPASIIAAIIGIETFYGQYKGKHLALPTLATLAFDYPPRASFFRSELEQFMLLAREEKFDPLAIKGSYAAAMGLPQFISSSYRRYAIDFDNDGQRDLWGSHADVIGSVANYLAEHGWRQGEPVAERVYPETVTWRQLKRDTLRHEITAAQIRDAGLSTRGRSDAKRSVFELRAATTTEAWVGYRNFYVITRYNHSRLYAMAVLEFSHALDS